MPTDYQIPTSSEFVLDNNGKVLLFKCDACGGELRVENYNENDAQVVLQCQGCSDLTSCLTERIEEQGNIILNLKKDVEKADAAMNDLEQHIKYLFRYFRWRKYEKET